jgi:excisionase family DNA binding protein
MTNELDRLLTITDLSEMLGVPVDTLYGWRHRGEGPAGYRIGRHVRYRRAAVEAWLDNSSRPAPPEATWRTLSGVAFNSATPRDEPGPLCTTRCVTAARLETTMQKQVLPHFGSVPLSRITNAILREWVSTLLSSGLSAATTRKAVFALRQCLAAAICRRADPN